MDAKSAAEIERLHAEQQARLDELASAADDLHAAEWARDAVSLYASYVEGFNKEWDSRGRVRIHRDGPTTQRLHAAQRLFGDLTQQIIAIADDIGEVRSRWATDPGARYKTPDVVDDYRVEEDFEAEAAYHDTNQGDDHEHRSTSDRPAPCLPRRY